jgi:hypothetical protein
MVNNSTNINKTSKLLNIENPQHMALEIHVLACDGHKKVAGLNQLMRSQPSLLLFTSGL